MSPSRLLWSQKKSNLCFGRRHKVAATLKTYTCAIIKKRNILLVAEQDRQIDLKSLWGQLGTGRLLFGSEDRLLTHLGEQLRAVTPLSMTTSFKNSVRLFIDRYLRSCSQIYAHPLVNDLTVALSIANLERFFCIIRVEPVWVDLSQP